MHLLLDGHLGFPVVHVSLIDRIKQASVDINTELMTMS